MIDETRRMEERYRELCRKYLCGHLGVPTTDDAPSFAELEISADLIDQLAGKVAYYLWMLAKVTAGYERGQKIEVLIELQTMRYETSDALWDLRRALRFAHDDVIGALTGSRVPIELSCEAYYCIDRLEPDYIAALFAIAHAARAVYDEEQKAKAET